MRLTLTVSSLRTTSIALSFAFAATGCFHDEPIGPVKVELAGTVSDGNVSVQLGQGWQTAVSGNIFTKYGYLLVGADGKAERVDTARNLLRADCSDEPVSMGPCIRAVVGGSKTAPGWSFMLPDGGEIEIVSGLGIKSTMSRKASDGSIAWTRIGPAYPLDTIRGPSVLVGNGHGASVEKLNIDTGETVWLVEYSSDL